MTADAVVEPLDVVEHICSGLVPGAIGFALDAFGLRWSEFRIWQDANGDGISQAGEVRSLDAMGIVSIGLDPSGPSHVFADGSAITGASNFAWKDGRVGTAADVSLAYQSGLEFPASLAGLSLLTGENNAVPLMGIEFYEMIANEYGLPKDWQLTA